METVKTPDGRIQEREVRSASGYGGSGPSRITFGLGAATHAQSPAGIDFEKARQLRQRMLAGERLTDEERDYLQRAIQARRQLPRAAAAPAVRASTGWKPLSDMSAEDRYKGEDGGLYGRGKNEPPPAHLAAARLVTDGEISRAHHDIRRRGGRLPHQPGQRRAAVLL